MEPSPCLDRTNPGMLLSSFLEGSGLSLQGSDVVDGVEGSHLLRFLADGGQTIQHKKILVFNLNEIHNLNLATSILIDQFHLFCHQDSKITKHCLRSTSALSAPPHLKHRHKDAWTSQGKTFQPQSALPSHTPPTVRRQLSVEFGQRSSIRKRHSFIKIRPGA